MKLEDVPQDNDPTYEGKKKLCYALDKNGSFVKIQTSGWSVEETVKGFAWQVLNSDLEKTRLQLKNNQASALAYFMKLRQMEPKLLAQNVGTWTWRVKWHLRPKVFSRLNEKWLSRYADCLDVPVDLLKTYRGEDAVTV